MDSPHIDKAGQTIPRVPESRWKMVGDPGIEPGMGLPGGVTVRCRTLQPVARREGLIRPVIQDSQHKFALQGIADQAKHRS